MKSIIGSFVRHWLSGLGVLLVGYGVQQSDASAFVASSTEVITGLAIYAVAQGASLINAKKLKELSDRFGF